MSAVLAAVLVVGWCLLLCWSFWRALEDESWAWGAVSAVALTAGVAFVIHAATQAEDEGPCLRKATGYVLSGKVMVPYTYCAERGEWVNR